MTKAREAMDALFEDEVQEVLRDSFYASEKGPKTAKAPPKRRRAKPKDVDYSVICISLYDEDLARLDEKVRALKESGHRKMSRSALIRFALDHVDLSELPKSY